MARVSGTEGYAEEAERLIEPYESLPFADVHGPVLHLLPQAPSSVLDIGAGTGRDAAAFAAMGHRVVAVEPTDELRMRGMVLHPSSSIEWLDDALPELNLLRKRSQTFDLVNDDRSVDASGCAAAAARDACRGIAGAGRRRADPFAASRACSSGAAHVRGLGGRDERAGAGTGAPSCAP
jgi:SAM-dependent methyltransferase